MKISPYYGIISTLRHLLEVWGVYSTGKHQLIQVRKTWTDIRSSQENLLLNILRENSQTSYGKEFKIQEIRSMEQFRQHHPLTTYEHFRKYAERAMEGESNVMTPKAPTSFVCTSGTTGKSKFIPLINRLDLIKTLLGRCSASAFENCPRLGLLQKQFLFYVDPQITKTKGGVNIEAFLTLSREQEDKLIPFTTPTAGFHISNLKDACYVHSLFALREPTIGVVLSFFIHYIESMMKLIERRWTDIVDDIAHGTIHEDIQLEDDTRSSLISALGSGDQERACLLRREFEKGMDGILKRVWPDLTIVIGIDNTRSWPNIERKYAKGIPLLPFVYGSSEGIIGHALWTQDKRNGYSLLTNEVVYEFIKFEDTELDQPQTYLPDEVEIGQRYEVVITQISGLYRYRMGDIIRVIGFEGNKVPFIEFQYRIGMMLNVRFEKINQLVVKETIKFCETTWSGVKLIDYTVAQNNLITEESPAYEKDEIMPYYLIFLELEFEDRNTPISAEERRMIDVKFRDLNSDYARLRREGSISHPRVHIVKPGTFEDLKSYILMHTKASANQYKVPRKLRTYGMLEVMLNHV
ncbi:indole-3-acetic acid-amido synthetase GH3.17 [Strongylocentrotus purpuratus]|uniref:Uncharacterized protein n=1 Tax=Strongylocentrotus purpuratus TaxID=7668 RepID=A0A7M7N2N6_STRPU|nr:indole-3-acetic acid-amido synthetase GH3.17 [Strongylocentrotus purpuratus]